METKCRACLTERTDMLSIYELYEYDLTLALILQNCLKIKVDKNDGLPSTLCENCASVLIQFYNFAVIYEESDRLLRKLQNDNLEHSISLVEDENDEYIIAEETDDLDLTSQNITTKQNEINDSSPQGSIKTEADFDIDCDRQTQTEDTKSGESNSKVVLQEINKYECIDCGEQYLYESSLQKHMSQRHNLNDINCDDYCTKMLIKVPVRSEQVPTVDNNFLMEEPKHKCKICNKSFFYKYLLQAHSGRFHQSKQFICEICGASFIRKTCLDDHRESHGTERRYKCKFCHKGFKRRTVLIKHRKIHTHPRQCICEVCGEAFTDNGTLNTHRFLKHVKERKFVCQICDQTFALKSTLDKHLRRHQNKHKLDKDFPCEDCGMQYSDKCSLKRHIQMKHQGTVVKLCCSECPKSYTSKSNLDKHLKKYHPASESKDEPISC